MECLAYLVVFKLCWDSRAGYDVGVLYVCVTVCSCGFVGTVTVGSTLSFPTTATKATVTWYPAHHKKEKDD